MSLYLMLCQDPGMTSTFSFAVLIVVTCRLVSWLVSAMPTIELQDFLLNLHNTARKAEPAAHMKKMYCDATLVARAQTWVDRCEYRHQEGQPWGENLAAHSYTEDIGLALRAMFYGWVGEKAHNPGGTFEECCSYEVNKCCHYTQVIWSTTSRLGCAYKRCQPLTTPDGRAHEDMIFLACYYDPPGNKPLVNCTYDWSPFAVSNFK